MLALALALAKPPFPYGPPPGPVFLAAKRPHRSWQIVVEHGGNGGVASFDLPDGLLLWTSSSVRAVTPEGRLRWRVPFEHAGKGSPFGPTGAAVGPSWVATHFELHADHYGDLVVVHDRKTGREIARFEIDRGHPATSITLDGDGLRLGWYDGAASYDLQGHETSRRPPPAPSPLAKNPYGGLNERAFAWQDGVVASWAYDDYPMDLGDLSGLTGVAFLRRHGVGETGDAWSRTFLRRVYQGYSGGGTYHETVPRPVGSFTGGPGDANDVYRRAVCADDEGVWLLHERYGVPGFQFVRVRASGMVDRTLQPYLDRVYDLPAWTDRGILFVRAGSSYLFDGRRVRGVGAWPNVEETRAVRASRYGLVRALNLPVLGSPGTTAFRLDPVAD